MERGTRSRQDGLSGYLRGQAQAWTRRWRWGLVVLIVLVWLPVLASLLHDLWSLALGSEQGLFGLPRSFFESRAELLLGLRKAVGSLAYISPVLRRLCAILAVTALVASLRLPGDLVAAASSRAVYQHYRAAVRCGVYRWLGILLVAPTLGTIAVYYGDIPLTWRHLTLMVIPTLLLISAWLSLGELVQYLVLRFLGRPWGWYFAVGLVVAMALLAATYYSRQALGRGFMKDWDWTPLLSNLVIVAGLLLLAAWWWWAARRPSAAFLARCAERVPGTAPVFPLPLRAQQAAPDPRTVSRRRIGAIGGGVLVLALLSVWGWVQVVESGVLLQESLPAPDVPVISTRGHLLRGLPTPGHTEFDYTLSADFPGMVSGPTAPADLVVVVHGFNNPPGKANFTFHKALLSLRSCGYEGPVAGFSWDADTHQDPFSATGYTTGQLHAVANGPKLARFVADYRQSCPSTRVHVVGYSMGARLALEALWALDEHTELMATGAKIDTVHLLGAAVDNEEVEVGERYGAAIEQRAGVVINYYSPVDKILGRFYPIKEADNALGKVDIEHPELRPANLVSQDVARELVPYDPEGRPVLSEVGEDHSCCLGYISRDGRLLDDGVLDRVVAVISEASVGTSQ